MRLLSLVAMMVTAVTVSTGTARSACMKADAAGEIAEGRLARQTFKDAAGRPERVFILKLPSPVCLSGTDEFDNVQNARTIQIYASDDTIGRRIARFADKTVLVRGKPFGAATVHHHAPIVMDISEIDSH
jgi:hypothetical protein